MCVKFIDTDKEKQIGIGSAWPFEKLKPNECLISNQFQKQHKVNVGDTVFVTFRTKDPWYTYYHQYNEIAGD